MPTEVDRVAYADRSAKELSTRSEVGIGSQSLAPRLHERESLGLRPRFTVGCDPWLASAARVDQDIRLMQGCMPWDRKLERSRTTGQ